MSHMSHFQSDSNYPGSVLAALNRIKQLFEDKDGETSVLEGLFTVLEDMRQRRPFRLVRHTGLSSPMLDPEAEYRYRTPVWELISTTVRRSHPACKLDQSKAAEWLQVELKTYYSFCEYEAVLEEFKKKIEGIHLSIDIHSSTVPRREVIVCGTFHDRGKQAKKHIRDIIGRLIPALAEHMKKK